LLNIPFRKACIFANTLRNPLLFVLLLTAAHVRLTLFKASNSPTALGLSSSRFYHRFKKRCCSSCTPGFLDSVMVFFIHLGELKRNFSDSYIIYFHTLQNDHPNTNGYCTRNHWPHPHPNIISGTRSNLASNLRLATSSGSSTLCTT
jgi:hypothetical protein